MTREEIRANVLEVIAKIVPDEDLNNLEGDANIQDQIELDSIDFLEIIMELRKRYGVEVPEDDYMELSTLDSIVDYLGPRMKDI